MAAELDIEDTATIQISFSTLSTAVGEDGAGGSDEPNESFVVDDDEDDDDDADGGGFKNPFRGESGGGRGRYKRPRGSRALNDAVAISVFAPLFHRVCALFRGGVQKGWGGDRQGGVPCVSPGAMRGGRA